MSLLALRQDLRVVLASFRLYGLEKFVKQIFCGTRRKSLQIKEKKLFWM